MRPSSLSLLLIGSGLEAILLFLVSVGDLRVQVPRFWVGIFPAFILYLLAILHVLKRPAGSLRLILLFAFLFRLSFWWSPPTLSDDIYRYVWDGRVQLAGVNPYLHPPGAEELAHLRDELYPGINHKEISTIYPPLSQLFFRLVYALHPGPGLMKFGLLLCEFGLVLLLVAILRQRFQDPRRVLLYAWNPLAIVEIAGSGHSDTLGIFLLMLALYWLVGGRSTAAVWALAGSFLGKLFPALVLPVFWRHLVPGGEFSSLRRWLHLRSRRVLIWFPLLSLLGFLPFLDAGPKLFAGLQTYLVEWRFNDAAFALLYDSLLRIAGRDHALGLAKWLSAGLLLLVALWTSVRFADPYRSAFWIMGAYLLLSPTLHPWYLLWILPFLPLFAHPAWILFSGLAFLAYEVLIDYSKTGIWTEQVWVKWAQYGPFYFLLATCSVYRHLSRDRRSV